MKKPLVPIKYRDERHPHAVPPYFLSYVGFTSQRQLTQVPIAPRRSSTELFAVTGRVHETPRHELLSRPEGAGRWALGAGHFPLSFMRLMRGVRILFGAGSHLPPALFGLQTRF